MITKFKIYDDNIHQNIEVKNDYFWWIEGDLNNIFKVLDIFMDYIIKNEIKVWNSVESIKRSLSLNWKNFQNNFNVIPTGMFIFMEDNNLTYWIVTSQDNSEHNRNAVIKKCIRDNSDFKGELKLENNKLFLDTLEAEIIKYNL